MSRFMRTFGTRMSVALNEPALAPAAAAALASSPAAVPEAAEAPRGYSSYEGFKSFANNGALSIETSSKASRARRPRRVPSRKRQRRSRYIHRVEPIRENVEPAVPTPAPIGDTAPSSTSASIVALLAGDRAAVFAALREQLKNGSPSACSQPPPASSMTRTALAPTGALLMRVARLAARLDTPTLERLVAASATGIDSSYADNVTGMKLALTRALAVLGA